jgi:diguanylate cyclase (GGDEF)-like protein
MTNKRLAPINDPTLKASDMFDGLSELELNATMAFLEPRSVKKGDVIFTESAFGEEMFILISGKLSAWINQPDGSRHQVFHIKPGDFFGEMSVIADESRSATIIADVDSELMVLNAIDFYRIIFEHPMIGVKILRSIRKVHNAWLDQLSKHLNDLARWGETARRRAVCDELTGLYNRRFLEESATERFEKGAVRLRLFSLMMMDLDKIHDVNTCYGNKAGDLVFISTAEVLRSTTRTGDICARLSGDEFAILLPDTKSDEAYAIAERIRQTLPVKKIAVPGNPDGTGQAEIVVNISIGIASAPVHADTWEALSQAADNALHRSKSLGRNRVEVAAD